MLSGEIQILETSLGEFCNHFAVILVFKRFGNHVGMFFMDDTGHLQFLGPTNLVPFMAVPARKKKVSVSRYFQCIHFLP